ncbi:MAG: hypothetical protein VX466_09125 [Myxococcota bacterium]|nr:hypothetical protein [Myxococcota bacterium]
MSRFGCVSLFMLLVSVACGSLTSEPVDLRVHERTVYSQFGEDGVIEKLFEIIEPTSRYCVEFGAHDGMTGSNVRNLLMNEGWSGLQIEGNEKRAENLAKNYAAYPQAKTLQAWVWPGNIEILFEEAGVPRDLDLLVIDIDSNDYYVWRAIRDYRPKVVLIEANFFFPPPQKMVIDYHPMNYWDGSHYLGASPQSLYDLAKKKGYELVHHMSWGPNLFFVDRKYYDRFGIEDNSPAKMMSPKVREMVELREKEGTPPNIGNPHLVWDELEIEKQWKLDR